MKKPHIIIIVVVLVALGVGVFIFSAVKSLGVVEPPRVVDPSTINEDDESQCHALLIEMQNQTDENVPPRVLLTIANGHSATVSDQTVRKVLLLKAIEIYNQEHGSDRIALTEPMIDRFAKIRQIGLSFNDLANMLASDADGSGNAVGTGLVVATPSEDAKALSDFQIWCKALTQLMRDKGDATPLGVTDEEYASVIELLKSLNAPAALSASKDIPYKAAQAVFDNMSSVKLYRFALYTK